MNSRNPGLGNDILPVDVVFHPAWWHRSSGLTFDEDFFYHPSKRVESERLMEKTLHDRFGDCGLGKDHGKDLPEVGAVHLAAGYIVSEMLGCRVSYAADAPPQVHPANDESLTVDIDEAISGKAWKRFIALTEALKERHGHLTGDVNWSGILNAALDVRGEGLFLDLSDRPSEVRRFFSDIAAVIGFLTARVGALTGTTSISVNRNLANFAAPIFLHSECSHTMISTDTYEKFLLGFDIAFSASHRPFGIHYCGKDPHRYAASFARIPDLDFLDLGWGGDVALLRRHLPKTFFNIRLDPVQIGTWTPDEIAATIARLVAESGDLRLTGLCCINMDGNVPDENVRAIFTTVFELREAFRKNRG